MFVRIPTTLLLLVEVLLVSVGLDPAQGVTQPRQTLSEFAAHTARAGKTAAVYSSTHFEPFVGTDPDFALNNFTVVLARLEEVSIGHDDFRIATLYRFQKLEVLSRRANVAPVNIGERYASLTPSFIGTPNGSDLLVIHEGGTLVVNGVKVTADTNRPAPDLRIAETYLLFLTTDEAVESAVLGLGSDGVFHIQDQAPGGSVRLRRVTSLETTLARELRERFQSSLLLLKSYLR
jgi:hypothetical protein